MHREVVHDPEEGEAPLAELEPEETLDLLRSELLRHPSRQERLREGAHLGMSQRIPLFARSVAHVTSERSEPKDAARIGGAEAQRVLLCEQRLPCARQAADLCRAGARRSRDRRVIESTNGGMDCPHRLNTAHEASRARRLSAEPRWSPARLNVTEQSVEASDLSSDSGSDRRGVGLVPRRVWVELVAELDRVDVAGPVLGIDDQNSVSGVAVLLGGDERCAQLELTRASSRIDRGVIRDECLRSR
jgi:hypothetical protein